MTSEECSARTWVMVICGPSGFTLPPLPNRTAFSGGTQPRSMMVAMRPAGPSTVAPVRFGELGDVAHVIAVAVGDQDHVDLAERVEVLLVRAASWDCW